MITIGTLPFPDSIEDKWERHVEYHAIHSKVLLVAVSRIEGAWSCYCVPVLGRSHEVEKHTWQTEGVKVRKALAFAAFPCFTEIPYDY